MPRVDRLSGGRLARSHGDDVGGVLLRQQPDVRRAGELETYRFLAVIAEAVAHARGEPLVGDAYVFADPEAGNARERPRRRLEDETHGACLPLRSQLVVVGMEHDRFALSDAEAVLEERATRDVVVALLAGRGAPLRQDPFRLEKRRVGVGAKVREVDAAEHAVPVDVVPLRAPEVLLRLTDLRGRIEDAAARELLADDEHSLLQAIGLGVLREKVAPERSGHEG